MSSKGKAKDCPTPGKSPSATPGYGTVKERLLPSALLSPNVHLTRQLSSSSPEFFSPLVPSHAQRHESSVPAADETWRHKSPDLVPGSPSTPVATPSSFWRLHHEPESTRAASNYHGSTGRYDSIHAAESSAASVATVERIQSLPFTTFPPLIREGSDSHGHGNDVSTSSNVSCQCDRRAVPAVMVAVILGLQYVACLGVFCVLASTTLMERDAHPSTFWKFLWVYVQPSLAIGGTICLATMLMFELYGLSDITFLYIQSAIFGLSVVTASGLVLQSLKQDSKVVKGLAVGSGIMMMGMATLGFARAVAVWRHGLGSVETDAAVDGDGGVTH